jgi:hypothetical protein
LTKLGNLRGHQKKVHVVSKLVVEEHGYTIVEEGTNKSMLLARLLAGVVLIHEADGVRQVLWRGGHAASEIDLAREVAMSKN